MFEGIKTLLNGAKTAAEHRFARLRQWTEEQLAALDNTLTKKVTAAQSTADAAQSSANAAQSTHQRTATYTFDGDTDGRAMFKWNAFPFYKVAEYPEWIIAVDNASGKTVSASGLTDSNVTEAYGVYRIGNGFVVKEAGTYDFPVNAETRRSMTVPEPGVYFIWKSDNTAFQTTSAELNFIGTFKEVATVNGVAPDETGNVEIEMPDASVFMKKTDPVGTGSFSMNRKEGSGVGRLSFTEGGYNIASHQFAHAEGAYTEASQICTHSEGFGTKAAAYMQHVQGSYNIVDEASGDLEKGKYIHIVGNGADEDNRSNAHTLDWDGNAWFAGDVFVGGTGQDDSTNLRGLIQPSDWEQNDETAADYVKHRTHYTVPATVVTDDTHITTASAFGSAYYKVSTLTPAKASIVGAKITIAGTTYTIDSSMISDMGTWFYITYPGLTNMASMAVVLGSSASGSFNAGSEHISYNFPSSGIYFLANNVTEVEYGGEVKRLEAKYLPESVESIVLSSSTSGSTKQFKITVDDTGALSAQEVTT